jgi:micrococcal nuclease
MNTQPRDNFTRRTIITNIVDGDTVDGFVDLGYRIWTEQRFRLLGIDTPERSQEGYTEATEYVKERILGKEVQLTSEKSDSFGRYLATIYFEDSIINVELLEKGFAKKYEK